jgi:oligopeptide/dipeptide ABC transporter ATP-binding protein
MSPLLSVQNLTVEYPLQGAFFPALESVSFELREGESVAIVGESGCGKTALARALIGLAPEGARVSGSLRLRDRELLGLPDREWRRVRGSQIAMIFQEPASALDPVMTIGDQIAEALRAHALRRRDARERARALLAEVAFPDPGRGVSEYAHRLSGGQRQRALIATALAGDPAILLADEPTTALDATIAAEVLELLDGLRRSRALALVLITHDLASVALHSDRVLVLYAGRVVEQAATSELFARPRHPYTRGLLACAPRLSDAPAAPGLRFAAIPGRVPEGHSRRLHACAFAPRCAERFERCDASEPPLYASGDSLARCFLYAEPR